MRRLPPLRLLNVFETVQRAGSPKLASGELNVSLSAVSQALRQLEDHIGAALFDRTTRPAKLTEAGEVLLKAVVENRERLDHALSDIQALTSNAGSAITVACTVGFATYWLMPRLEAFYLDHPDIVVNVQTTPLEVSRMSPGTDIAMRFGDGRWKDGDVEHLFDEVIEPVWSPALAERLAKEGRNLASAYLIHVDFPDPNWIAWPEYFARTGQKPTGSAKGLRFSNYVQAAQAALSGHGIMLGWRSTNGDHVDKGLLVPVGLPPMHPKSGFYTTLSHRSRNPEATQVVIDWMKKTAARNAKGPDNFLQNTTMS
ncbi:MAG: LysR family transcriptional regulator [Roseibium sp.]|uniref:LysR substrate-binding domain-containing protein n=1 Tax=Roseibium sp. TaxID=1936156 RepID=UPI002627C0CF|nr:LysR substrate-binding domain-containing protein [Roseibium sp.]MCV0426271.1 LysR family transcriptional regulator [Roseibium sp.]